MLYLEALKHKMQRKFEVRDYSPTEKKSLLADFIEVCS